MITSFLDDAVIGSTDWAAFERAVDRLLRLEGFPYSSVVGRSGDGGADVLAVKGDKRWLVQVKRWSNPAGPDVVAETVEAARRYGANIPVVVCKSGFTADVMSLRDRLAADGINLQLWDMSALQRRVSRLSLLSPVEQAAARYALREYQETAVQRIVAERLRKPDGSALVVLATGLGKTFVACEALRRSLDAPGRVLVLAHTNDLVLQLERAFWPFLRPNQATCVIAGGERPKLPELGLFSHVFATRDSIDSLVQQGVSLPRFDVVVVDECHHLGAETYERVLDALDVGSTGGPFLLGLTATPWRPNGEPLDHRFDAPVVSVDLSRGLREGHLANVDYRIYTDNVNWDALRDLHGDRFTPRAINKTLFIDEWDDAVIERTREAWLELPQPRGIVFCGTVDHAERVAARVNALGFTNAKAIFATGSDGRRMSPVDRNRVLWDFASGRLGIICAVDVLNEGVDVPDVNLVVFQRVTHSRRIFVQQLGRGLRLAPGKEKVVVLDFVSDVRRFAAGLELQRSLDEDGPKPGDPRRVQLRSRVSFRRANEADEQGATFLQQWLKDLEDVEAAGEDVSVLEFPPLSNLPRRRGTR